MRREAGRYFWSCWGWDRVSQVAVNVIRRYSKFEKVLYEEKTFFLNMNIKSCKILCRFQICWNGFTKMLLQKLKANFYAKFYLFCIFSV